ncbi:putative GNAT family N-acetyltransferase [Acephala macrosclerotiorum]|nr:putative GNAT family N-acetyltransferase [Acephala macrosclerotiorum]
MEKGRIPNIHRPLYDLRQTVNEMFASNDIHWAKPTPDDVMRETLQNSLCFGLYNTSSMSMSGNSSKGAQIEGSGPRVPGEFIGLARCVTDYTTFVYLTDVYILLGHQGTGLGKWLIGCVQDIIDEMPCLRRSMLFTSDWKRSVPFYENILDMEVMAGEQGDGPAVKQKKGPGFPRVLR